MNDKLNLIGELLQRTDVPAYTREKWGVEVAEKSLAKYASIGGGPAYRKLGRKVVYERRAIDEWMAARLTDARFTSTSDEAHQKEFPNG